MTPSDRVRTFVAVLVGVVLGFEEGSSQRIQGSDDIAVQSVRADIPLPEAYLTQVRARPDLFTLPPDGWSARTGSYEHAEVGVTGTLPVLIVPALFSDSPEPNISAANLQAALFDGPSADGTITDFYAEVSHGRLSVAGLVAPWVRTSISVADAVGNSNGLGSEARLGEYLHDAIVRTDSNVDLRSFDNDGPDGIPNSGDDDGFVDIVAFEFLEISAPCGGSAVWPHRSSLSGRFGAAYSSQDIGFDGTPIQVDGYVIQGATECDGVSVQSSNTLAHELGHVLGLPDLYHPIEPGGAAGRRWIVGCWGLMGAGSWGCGFPGPAVSGYGPIHMTPWSKAQLGWIRYEAVTDVVNRTYLLDPVQTGGKALRIRMLSEVEEYVVIEYRPRIGFDRDLPDSGVLIYRENPLGSLRPVAAGIPYRFHLLEADGRTDLLRTLSEGGNRGDAQDAFARDGRVDRLSSLTTPGTVLSDGSPSPVTIHEIAVENGRARIRLTNTRAPVVTSVPETPTPVALEPIELRYEVFGGRPPYQLKLFHGALPEGLEVLPSDEALILAGWLLESGSFRAVFDVLDSMGYGAGASLILEFEIDPFSVENDRVIRTILENTEQPLTDGEAAFIDVNGNDNGVLDIGDLRAALRRNR